MTEFCLQDESEGKGIYSPCLKPKNHLGKHIHKPLCDEPACTCGGFQEKIHSLGYYEKWNKLKETRNNIECEMFKIRNKIAKQVKVMK